MPLNFLSCFSLVVGFSLMVSFWGCCGHSDWCIWTRKSLPLEPIYHIFTNIANKMSMLEHNLIWYDVWAPNFVFCGLWKVLYGKQKTQPFLHVCWAYSLDNILCWEYSWYITTRYHESLLQQDMCLLVSN